jgi:hypothetical protein
MATEARNTQRFAVPRCWEQRRFELPVRFLGIFRIGHESGPRVRIPFGPATSQCEPTVRPARSSPSGGEARDPEELTDSP